MKVPLDFILFYHCTVGFYQSYSECIGYLLCFENLILSIKPEADWTPLFLPCPIYSLRNISISRKKKHNTRGEKYPEWFFLCKPGVSGWSWMGPDSRWSWCQTVVVSHNWQSKSCCRDGLWTSKSWVYVLFLLINTIK